MRFYMLLRDKNIFLFVLSFFLYGCDTWIDKKKVTLPIERRFHTYDNMNLLFSEPVDVTKKNSGTTLRPESAYSVVRSRNSI